MFQGPSLTPLQWANNYIHLIGWPALIAIVWKARGLVAEFLDGVRTDRKTLSETKAGVDLIASNHLAHLATDMQTQIKKQEETQEGVAKTVEILQSIDKGIAVLVDRSK